VTISGDPVTRSLGCIFIDKDDGSQGFHGVNSDFQSIKLTGRVEAKQNTEIIVSILKNETLMM
jgi:hypothetical protein